MNSSVDRHLGCFHVLVIVNRAAMNIRVHIPFQIIIFSRYMPKSKTAKAYGHNSLLLVQFNHSVMSNSLQAQASLSITNSRSLLKLTSTESVMPSNHLILCRPLRLLTSVFPSIRVFSNESALHIRWPEFWSFRFNISPSNEYSGPTSFRVDWLDLFAVQGTLQSLLQHHSLWGWSKS